MKGYVYLLLSISPDNVETHKIGITTRKTCVRVKEHQTGNPNKISILREYETTNYLKVEKWLHRKYGSQKTDASNEWRTLTDEQVFSFLDDCAEADETINFLLNNNSLFD
jgi:hypothetical protein